MLFYYPQKKSRNPFGKCGKIKHWFGKQVLKTNNFLKSSSKRAAGILAVQALKKNK